MTKKKTQSYTVTYEKKKFTTFNVMKQVLFIFFLCSFFNSKAELEFYLYDTSKIEVIHINRNDSFIDVKPLSIRIDRINIYFDTSFNKLAFTSEYIDSLEATKESYYYENGVLAKTQYRKLTPAIADTFGYEDPVTGAWFSHLIYDGPILSGKYQEFFNDGSLKVEGQYSNDGDSFQVGEWNWFYKNGSKYSCIIDSLKRDCWEDFSNVKKEIISSKYDSLFEIEASDTIQKMYLKREFRKLNPILFIYNGENQILFKREYFKEDQLLKSTHYFKNGEKEMEYFTSYAGDVDTIGYEDPITGNWHEEYIDNGKIKVGKFIRYYESGIKKIETTFLKLPINNLLQHKNKGSINGLYQEWDIKGNLIRNERYEKGVLKND